MKKITIHAATAKAIRGELKKKFPITKFNVTSSSFAGGNSVAVEWIDGETSKDVEDIVDKYQYGHFDGMCDSYEYSNSRKDIPQVKYVQVRREISEQLKEKALQYLKKTRGNFNEMLEWQVEQEIYRILVNKDLTLGLSI